MKSFKDFTLYEAKIIGQVAHIINSEPYNKPLRLNRKKMTDLEKLIDKQFANQKIDVDILGKHFIDRANDERNGEPITSAEIRQLFSKAFNKYSKELGDKKSCGLQAVIHDKSTDLNVPFMMKCKGKIKKMIGKTIMRKRNFKTSNRKMVV